MVEADDLSMYDHVRPADGASVAVDSGVYRIVGLPDDSVTLLRVGDADGRRVNSGEVRQLDAAALQEFEETDNPDGNRSLGATVVGQLGAVYWMLRSFGSNLAAHPLPALVFLAVLAFGTFGASVVSWPELWLDVLVFAGALGVAYVGSGRL